MTTVREARVAAAKAVLKGHLDDGIMVRSANRYKTRTDAVAEVLAGYVVDALFLDHTLDNVQID